MHMGELALPAIDIAGNKGDFDPEVPANGGQHALDGRIAQQFIRQRCAGGKSCMLLVCGNRHAAVFPSDSILGQDGANSLSGH